MNWPSAARASNRVTADGAMALTGARAPAVTATGGAVRGRSVTPSPLAQARAEAPRSLPSAPTRPAAGVVAARTIGVANPLRGRDASGADRRMTVVVLRARPPQALATVGRSSH